MAAPMGQDVMHDVTGLLQQWHAGDPGALAQLMPVVYDALHRIARARLKGERVDHTLQPTALVNELFLKLSQNKSQEWENRSHFFGAASEIIRRILVDAARKHQAAKRGAHLKVNHQDTLEAWASDGGCEDMATILALDDALDHLETMDARQAKVVKLKYFVGLNIAEIAEVTGIAVRTVKNDWTLAKAWLFRRLTTE